MTWKEKNIAKLNSKLLKSMVLKAPKSISSIGFIVDQQSELNFNDLKKIQDLISQQFKLSKDLIKGISFENNNGHASDNDDWFCVKDFSFFGSLKYNSLHEFVKNDFDLLIIFQNSPNVFLNHVILQSKAGFKAGYESAQNEGIQFELRGNDFKELSLLQEIEKYLKLLQS
ncbi:MAG: DUF6913 domain-containing protein [Flavobacteriaceae bacterium]